MTKTTNPPETLDQDRSPNTGDRPGPVGTVYRSPVPPLYRAGPVGHPGPTTPKWLDEKIGHTRRKATPKNCPNCGAALLVGPDHDRCATTARVNPTPVDPITEVIALLAGRHSYDLDRGALHHREPEHHHSPNRRHPVLLEHRCGDQP